MVKYFMSDRRVTDAPPMSPTRKVTSPTSPRKPIFCGSGSSSPTATKEHEVINDEAYEGGVDAPSPFDQKWKWSYEMKLHFQPRWAALHPWAKPAMVDVNGDMT